VTGAIDVEDIRVAVQIQRVLERNARGGTRYNEWLKSHHNVDIGDGRLNRPEYIGGLRTPIVVSEVLQTGDDPAATPTPIGHMAGHGIAVEASRIGKYRVPEYGLIMALMTVRPRTAYHEGISKMWIKRDNYDFFHSEFVNLSEQAVELGEVYVAGAATDADIFGYQGRYNELRYIENSVTGKVRPGQTFDAWSLARNLGGAPTLNTSFVECDNTLKRHLADNTEDGFIAHIGHLVTAARPIPVVPTPGLVDH
jgi:hypothetical protein